MLSASPELPSPSPARGRFHLGAMRQEPASHSGVKGHSEVVKELVAAAASNKKSEAVVRWKGDTEVFTIATFPSTNTIVAAGGGPFHLSVYRLEEPTKGCLPWSRRRSKEQFQATLQKHLRGHQNNVREVTLFTPEGDDEPLCMFSAGADGQCFVWDARTWKKKEALGACSRIKKAHFFEINCISAFRDHQSWLVTGSTDRTIKLWDWVKNQEITVLQGHESIPTAIVTGQGGLVYSGSRSGKVRVWDARVGHTVGIIADNCSGLDVAHRAQISRLGYSYDRDELYSSSFDCLIKSWREPGKIPQQHHMEFQGHKGVVRDFSLTGNAMISCSVNRTMRVWNVESGKNVATIMLPGWANCVRVMGEYVVAGSQEKQLSVWPMAFPLEPEAVEASKGKQYITNLATFTESGFQDCTYVVVRNGQKEGRDAFLRVKATIADLPTIGEKLSEAVKKREDPITAAPRYSSLKKANKRRARSASVSFSIYECKESSPTSLSREVEKWKDKYEQERAKALRTLDALKEARMARDLLTHQLINLKGQKDQGTTIMNINSVTSPSMGPLSSGTQPTPPTPPITPEDGPLVAPVDSAALKSGIALGFSYTSLGTEGSPRSSTLKSTTANTPLLELLQAAQPSRVSPGLRSQESEPIFDRQETGDGNMSPDEDLIKPLCSTGRQQTEPQGL